MKLLELFTVSPFTWTLMGPVVAPLGYIDLNAGARLSLRILAGVPLKVTMPLSSAVEQAGAGDGHWSAGRTTGGRDSSDGGIGIEGEGLRRCWPLRRR